MVKDRFKREVSRGRLLSWTKGRRLRAVTTPEDCDRGESGGLSSAAKTRVYSLSESAAWSEALADLNMHDVYYRPGYLRSLEERGEGEALLFRYEQQECRGAHVILRRSLRNLDFRHPQVGAFDATSPYGYSGPVISDASFASAMWASWRREARRLGLVTEFIRFNPMKANHRAFEATIDVEEVGETIWIDLHGDIFSGLSKSTRSIVRLARRDGVVIEQLGVDAVARFGSMYRETMRKVKSSAYYLFSDGYFLGLMKGLGEDAWLMRARVNGEDVAYALCLRHGDILHYHLGCSRVKGKDFQPTRLLLYETAVLAQKRHCTKFHLGGGKSGEDSLFKFKARFSDQRSKFAVGRVVHDVEAYETLEKLAYERTGSEAHVGFFPSYRGQL